MKKNWKLIVGILFIICGLACLPNIGETACGVVIGAVLVYLWFKPRKSNKTQTEQTVFEYEAVSPEKRELIKEVHTVAGIGYYQDNLKKLACKNSDWSKSVAELKAEDKLHEKIYRYNYINKPIKLVYEPENENDPNAIMILIAGEKVGYVFADETAHIKDILENHEVKYISAFVHGGEYKVVNESKTAKLCENVGVKWTIAYV